MAEHRFFSGGNGDRAVVIDVPIDKFNALKTLDEQKRHTLVEITAGGAISKLLAKVWVDQIADQLNSFDVANAAVAKLK